MSTAGKVLTVLCVLLAAVWVLLAASVTQLNRNGAKAVDDLQKKVAGLEKDMATVRKEVRELTDEAYLERMRSQTDLTTLQSRQAAVEHMKSVVLESLTRVQADLGTLTATIDQGKVEIQKRQAEKAEETRLKAEAVATVEKQVAENGQLREQLNGLRAKFQSTLEANKAMVQRLIQAGQRTVRPASLPSVR